MGSSKPTIQALGSKPRCVSHEPGHQVHWIQARVKYDKPRFDAEVEVLDQNRVRVSWLDQSHVFTHHNTAGIQAALEVVVLGYVRFAPGADLLYIQTEEANEQHGGAFALFYLCKGEPEPCAFRWGTTAAPRPNG